MSSAALTEWNGGRADRLDELEHVHRSLTGTAPGRRWVTEQLNRAYLITLASQFQGFCRDLHSEGATLVASQSRTNLRDVFDAALTLGRHLDRGNATPGNLGRDFGRFGFAFWPAVYARDAHAHRRREMLEQVLLWRNSIAHATRLKDAEATLVHGTGPTMTWGRRWRRGLGALAHTFDRAVGEEISVLIGRPAW